MKTVFALIWLVVAFVGIGLAQGQSPGTEVTKFKNELKSELAITPVVTVDQRLFGLNCAREVTWRESDIDYDHISMYCRLQTMPLSAYTSPALPASALLPARTQLRSQLGSLGNPIQVYNSPFGSFKITTYSPPDVARQVALPYRILN